MQIFAGSLLRARNEVQVLIYTLWDRGWTFSAVVKPAADGLMECILKHNRCKGERPCRRQVRAMRNWGMLKYIYEALTFSEHLLPSAGAGMKTLL